MYTSTLSLTWGWVANSTPRPLYPRGRDPVPIIIGGWVRAPGPVWAGAENLAPLDFGPRTVQPVVSLYAKYAIAAPKFNITAIKNNPTNSINCYGIHKWRNFVTYCHTHLSARQSPCRCFWLLQALMLYNERE